MLLLPQVIQKLSLFSADPAVQSILEKLYIINPEALTQKNALQLRKELRGMLSGHSDTFLVGDVSLSEAIYDALLVVANMMPVNTLDPLTWTPILPEHRVVIASGLQFNIYDLVQYHNQRMAQATLG